MIELKDKWILVDGVPRVVMAGEVHYFRVAREEWDQRLDLLEKTGCRAVASYIPWIFHELPDASIDVAGRTRPEHPGQLGVGVEGRDPGVGGRGVQDGPVGGQLELVEVGDPTVAFVGRQGSQHTRGTEVIDLDPGQPRCRAQGPSQAPATDTATVRKPLSPHGVSTFEAMVRVV